MDGKKIKFALWMWPETKEKVERFYRADNCKSQSEFIEKAINFYAGYLHAKAASDYLPRVLHDVLGGYWGIAQKKIGRMLFKVAVETQICNHILAFDTDIDDAQLEKLYYRCVKEVAQTNGEISFKDALKFQKEIH